MKRTGSIGSWVGPAVISTCRPRERPRRFAPAAMPRHRRDDVGRLRHAAGPKFAASHLAVLGADEGDPVGLELRDVALRRRMRPHPHVHRRGDQHPLVGGEQRRRGEIVGEAVRHLGEKIGGCRRDDDAGRPSATVRYGPSRASSARLNRSWRTGAPLSAAADSGVTKCSAAGVSMAWTVGAAFAQPADQFERLEGRDAAADDQQNAGAVEIGCRPWLRRIPVAPLRLAARCLTARAPAATANERG